MHNIIIIAPFLLENDLCILIAYVVPHFRDSLAGPFSSGIVLVSLYVEVSDLKENALVSLARPNFLITILN